MATNNAVNTYITPTANNEVTMPSQPAFMAWIDTTILNVTGDATLYTIIYDTEEFDVNADFNLGTSTFTAPVTGKYEFSIKTCPIGAAAYTSLYGEFVASNCTYRYAYSTDATECQNIENHNGTTLVDMDASDTLTVNIYYAGDTKTVALIGDTGGQPNNWLCGYLAT